MGTGFPTSTAPFRMLGWVHGRNDRSSFKGRKIRKKFFRQRKRVNSDKWGSLRHLRARRPRDRVYRTRVAITAKGSLTHGHSKKTYSHKRTPCICSFP